MPILWRILTYLGKYKTRLIVAYVSLFIGLAALLSIPRLVEYVIDEGIAADNQDVIIYGSLAVVGVAIAQSIFTFLRQYLFQAIAEQVATDLRAEYYRKLQTLPFSFYDKSQSGQLMARGTQDITSIRQFLMFSLRMLVYGGAMTVGILFLMFLASPTLAIIVALIMLVLFASAIRFGSIIRPMFLAIQQQFGEVSSVMQENLAGTRVVRAFAQERREINKFDGELDGYFNKQMGAVGVWSKYFPTMTFVHHLAFVIVLLYGGRQVLNGSMSPGTLASFNLYLALLIMPVRTLGFIVNSMARAIASGNRIFEIIDTAPAIDERDEPVDLEDPKGTVTFENVSFAYPGTDHMVLNGINLTVEPDKVVALFGSTGAGKSTLTSLIPRFYDVSEGTVTIDGYDVRDLTLSSLRRHVGFVLQDTFLFSAAIRDNIAYGNEHATDEQIERAARIANAHKFIMDQPEGYDTVLAETGVSLSGGQKQRIAIARALCSDPRILILDDATSSVDTETEFEIQQALRDAMVGRTTFIIAQRLSTLKHADEIIVLDQGAVVERGTHDELLRESGLYARVYELQLKDQEELLQAAD